MLIPISLLWPELRLPEGFEELPVDVPQWWIEPSVPQPLSAPVAEPTIPRAVKIEEPTLFDQRPAETVTPAVAWIAAFLNSEILVSQKQRAGRAPIDEKVLQKFLEALASRGGSMTASALAHAIGTPEHRLSGLLAVMQRVLNVEGYAILDRQDASSTIVLNIPLLKKQFEIGSA